MRTFLRDTLVTLVLAAIIFLGLQTTVDSVIVIGPSMKPGFQNGQRLLINKAIYKFFREPERGEVVVFHPPNNEQDDYIKRIIGLPGESIEVRNGTVYVHKKDGSVLPLDEPYVTARARYPFKGDKIPANYYFVLGDNRNNSSDSRDDWVLPRENIIGKAWLSVWPPGLVTNYQLPQ